MNNKYLAISLSGLLSLGLAGCFTDSTSSLPTVPTSSQVLFEIPASLVLGSDQDTAIPMSMAKLNSSLFDPYKPITDYIALAEEARSTVAKIIDNLEKENLAKEVLIEENGTRIETMKLDSSGVKWQVVNWRSPDEDQSVRLVLRNSSNTYVGHATLHMPTEGSTIRVDFSGKENASTGHRMKITIHKPIETLINLGAPAVIVVNALKKGSKVFVSGTSVHPTFKDDFWFDGLSTPAVYSFLATADTQIETAVLRAAFGPQSEVGPNFLTEYALDTRIIKTLHKNIQQLMENDPEAKEAIFWSLEKELPLTTSSSPLRSIYIVTRQPDSFTEDEVSLFADIQLKSDSTEEVYRDLAIFAKAKQPIFLSRGAVIIGNKDHIDESAITIKESDLDETLQSDTQVDAAIVVDDLN